MSRAPPASATRPRTAPARAPPVRRIRSPARRRSVAPRPASATPAENCTGSGAACPADAFASSRDGLPRLGRHLRRRRELHGLERRPVPPTLRELDDGLSRLGRRLRRGRELHGLERRLSGRQLRPSVDRRAAARPASATSPRTAPARAPPVRPTPSSRRRSICRAVGGHLRRRRELHRLDRTRVPPTPSSSTTRRLPRLGGRLRRRRELHRLRAPPVRRYLRAGAPSSAAPRPASATSPRTAPAARPTARPTPSSRTARRATTRPPAPSRTPAPPAHASATR